MFYRSLPRRTPVVESEVKYDEGVLSGMSEWYDLCEEDETNGAAGEPAHLAKDRLAKQEKNRQKNILAEQRTNILDALLKKLHSRFPLLAEQFKGEIAQVEPLDLLRRLSINIALARNETLARQAILAAIQIPQSECPDIDCTNFLLEKHV